MPSVTEGADSTAVQTGAGELGHGCDSAIVDLNNFNIDWKEVEQFIEGSDTRQEVTLARICCLDGI